MSKITRRLFLGASLALVATPWAWFQVHTRAPRAKLANWRRRFHRWRTGMQPRWSDWSSATFHRDAVAQDGSPMPHKIINNWRELRWPDNNELVERVTLESEMQMLCMDITYDSAAGIDFRGGVDWNPNELGHRLPGPKCATPDELIDKVRHAAKYDVCGEPGFEERDQWIADAKATVAKWDMESPPEWNKELGEYPDAKPLADWREGLDITDKIQVSKVLMAKLEADALPVIEHGDARVGFPAAHWGIVRLGPFEV